MATHANAFTKEITPRVSVIIPVYNVEQYLAQCLDSVINQTLREIEIICVNDGSTDNSLKVLQKYARHDSRIHVISQQNAGLSITRNVGIRHARAPYIFFCDSDDWLDLKCLEKLYKEITKTNADICIYGLYWYDEATQSIREHEKFFISYKPVNSYKEISDWVFKNWSSPLRLYNRTFFINNDLWFPEHLIFEDVVVHVKAMLAAQKISFVNERLYYYRVNKPTGIMTESKNSEKILDAFQYFSAIEELILRYDAKDILGSAYKKFFKHETNYHKNRTTNAAIQEKFINHIHRHIQKSLLLMDYQESLIKIYLFGIPVISINQFSATPGAIL